MILLHAALTTIHSPLGARVGRELNAYNYSLFHFFEQRQQHTKVSNRNDAGMSLNPLLPGIVENGRFLPLSVP
jgi:hypothetical protein